MTNAELIFVAMMAALLLIWAAWTFTPRDSRFTEFWIGLTGRRTAGPPSVKARKDRDRQSTAADAGNSNEP